MFSTAEFFDYVKQSRNNENRNAAGRRHSSDDGRAHDLAGYRASAAGTPEGHATEDECEGSHKDWAETKLGAFQCRVYKRLTFFEFQFGKFHNQDGVLGCETNQHDQTNLRVDVVLEAQIRVILKNKETDNPAG